LSVFDARGFRVAVTLGETRHTLTTSSQGAVRSNTYTVDRAERTLRFERSPSEDQPVATPHRSGSGRRA
jgi:hypothetical protein